MGLKRFVIASAFALSSLFGPVTAAVAGEGSDAHLQDNQRMLLEQAESGNPQAQFELGNRYLNGEGVEQDNFEALRWFTLAADRNNANAQYNIAVMYLNGLGVVKDQAQAVEWFIRAAENGDPPSQYTLGVLLFNGQLGVPQDVAQAYKWFTLAGAAGHQMGAANAVLVQELLPPNHVDVIQQEVRTWIDEFNQRRAEINTLPVEIP